jgi:hypothetical protein
MCLLIKESHLLYGGHSESRIPRPQRDQDELSTQWTYLSLGPHMLNGSEDSLKDYEEKQNARFVGQIGRFFDFQSLILSDLDFVAESEGFEPPIALRRCLISSQVHSTGLCQLSCSCKFT